MSHVISISTSTTAKALLRTDHTQNEKCLTETKKGNLLYGSTLVKLKCISYVAVKSTFDIHVLTLLRAVGDCFEDITRVL